MTDELITFVRAALDRVEDQARVAAALSRSPWRTTGTAVACGDGYPVALAVDGETATAEHIALHDPASVLADVAAKRAILDEHRPDTQPDGSPANECLNCYSYEWPCKTLRLLAQPYADQPGWREEWRA